MPLRAMSTVGRIREVDVGPAVAIVVDQDHAAAHGFHDVFLGRVGGVFEGDAGLGSDVFELWNRAAAALRLTWRRAVAAWAWDGRSAPSRN